jgi:hypothetical protein
MLSTISGSPEFLTERHVNRSAYVIKTALPTRIYLGVCKEHDRPVRFEVEDDAAVARRQIPCPEGGHLIQGELLQAVTTKLVCDGQCMSAFRNFCGCGCGGANHGKTWGTLLGQSEQLDSALDKWRTARRKVEAKREQRRQSAERKAKATFEDWAEEHQDVIRALDAWYENRTDDDWQAEQGGSHILVDLAIQTHGGWNGKPKPLTDRQIELVFKILSEAETKRRELAARAAAARPCPTGRVEISGEIVKVTCREGYMGGTTEMKATVSCDGYAVWVTLPRVVEDWARANRKDQIWRDWSPRNSYQTDYHGASARWTDALKGVQISFTAQIERSQKDQSFGFGKRPVKVTYAAPADN